MTVSALLASRKTIRAFALIIAACLGLSVLTGAAAPERGGEAETPPFRPTGHFAQGVRDALWICGHRLDEASQDVLTEQALQAARQASGEIPTPDGEQLESAGRYTKDVASSRNAQESAEREALRTSQTPATDSSGQPPADGATGEAASSTKGPASLICFLGEEVPFRQGTPADAAAPVGYASTWVGTGCVSDNANTYFIGHNPGVFARVMDLNIGDKITVFDDEGASRTYYVFDTLFLPNKANYFVYEGRIAPAGETITLQTCSGDNQRVRCVMAR